ncbi:MAG TPA: ABC transporter substrate-binding protein [Actinomycetota bacterium]|nr:ABC transporter substrate-binding protein [Actinomycetota bacterium]
MDPTRGRRRARGSGRTATIALIVLASLIAAACGPGPANDRPAPAAGGTEGAFPVTIDSAAGSVELVAAPERIVSLSPSSTEMLFAIEAGDQVVAVDDQSDFPSDAPITDLSGYEPNVEAIASYEPDLVVMDVAPPALKRSFKKLAIPLLQQPAPRDITGTYAQIEELGAATGHTDEAAGLVSEMQADIDELVVSIPTFDEAPTYYHELDDTYFSVTSETFIGEVYSMMGLENIADEAKGAGSGYPQLSGEYIIEADPDLIFLADTDCCDQSAETVAERAGWNQIAAVRNGHVVELSDDVASRWGPRVVEFLRNVADAVNELDG